MTGLDVEAARKVLLDSLPPRDPKWRIWVDGILERLTPCVTDDPQVIDRDALLDLLADRYSGWHDLREEHEANADAILALAAPVDGIVLTREEALLARNALAFKDVYGHSPADHEALVALGNRLWEAAR